MDRAPQWLCCQRPRRKPGPSSFQSRQLLDELPVRVGPAVAEELPGLADLEDLVEVEVGDDERVLVPGSYRFHLTPRVAEVRLAVELAHVPGLFLADAVDRADEVLVGDRVRGLLELPEILR